MRETDWDIGIVELVHMGGDIVSVVCSGESDAESEVRVGKVRIAI